MWPLSFTLGFATLLPVSGQVFIEGGTNGVRISNRDGKIDGRPTTPVEQTVTTSPATGISPTSEFQVIQPVRGKDFTLTIPVVPQPAPEAPGAPAPADTGQPAEAPTIPVIDMSRQLQVDQMARKLGMLNHNQVAALTYKAEDLFQPGLSEISIYAKPTLDKLVDFFKLAQSRTVSVTYQFHAEEDTGETARARAQALADYLSAKTGSEKTAFTVADPKPVEKPVVKNELYRGKIQKEFKSLVSIVSRQ